MTTTKAKLWRGNQAATRERQATLQRAVAMIETYKSSPWVKPQHIVQAELKELLAEVDLYAIQNALDLRGWDILSGQTGDATDERKRAVRASKWLYKYNPLAQWSIWLWTSWGMGDKVRVSAPDNPKADDAVQEFFTAERNGPVLADDNIKELSRWLLTKGNRFFVFFTSTADGLTTIRTIDQSEMTPICNPDDSKEVWFYRREWTPRGGKQSRTVYYPDWKVYFSERNKAAMSVDERWQRLVELKTVRDDAKKSWGDGDDIGDGDGRPSTDAYILWTAHNIKDETTSWGWPIMTTPRAWLQAHQELMEGRLTVSRAASMFVRRKQVKGGKRGVNSIINTVKSNLSAGNWSDSNPPATAGSVEVDNAMVDTTDLPLTTGAGDTSTDNKTFSWMALLGAGLFPTSAGLDTARWATALEMDKAQSMLFETYKNFWAAQFRKIGNIALLALEKWSSTSFGDYTIVVSIDTFSLADFPAIARTIGGFVRDTITPLVEAGVVSTDAALAIVRRFYKMALDSLGVEDAADLVSDEAFSIGDFAEPEPEATTPAEPTPAIERVLENLREGAITEETAALWAIGEMAELLELVE